MEYNFPQINHIDDVLPHLDDDNFIVAKKEGYTVINYILPDNTTFPPVKTVGDAIRRECRGIIFDADGFISARRYHKFFNCGEREETLIQNINWELPHVILEKLDGSMVTPFQLVDGTILWGTKMGATDVAAPVTDFVSKNQKYTDFANRAFASGTTPIFEWLSPQQRIVLGYSEDQLILTAIRGTVSGWYMPYEAMVQVAKKYDIPVVQTRFKYQLGDTTVKPEHFLELFNEMENEEGVVVRFETGHQIKVKCEWYVRIHKNKELVSSEKNLVELIVNQQLDDVIPFLMEADREKVLKYQDDFLFEIKYKAVNVDEEFYALRTANITRKEFAVTTESWNPMLRATIFKLWDVETIDQSIIKEHLIDLVKKHCTSNQMFAKLKGWLLKDVNYGTE